MSNKVVAVYEVKVDNEFPLVRMDLFRFSIPPTDVLNSKPKNIQK